MTVPGLVQPSDTSLINTALCLILATLQGRCTAAGRAGGLRSCSQEL